ncbi:TolC family protein [Clostridium aestuarii]|uniref:TolC family protein n=1 Tax=Clostridium aestuarii TaxID=338193 RepID=A0ABT4CVC6_9CLOT|nr:TolC family protein [Clostridium aestuarii]MCY6482943.1 TolC family protein [Clostridium aestuarii]
MRNKKIILKTLSLCFASIFLGGMVLSASAAPSTGVLRLSKEEAVTFSRNSNTDLKRLKTGLNTLNRKFKKYKDLSREAAQAKDDFEDYKEAYKKINSDEFKAQKKQLSDTVKGYSEIEDGIKKLKEKLKSIPDNEENAKTIEKIKTKIAEAEAMKAGLDAKLALLGVNIDYMRKKYEELKSKEEEFEAAKAKVISVGLADNDGKPKYLSSKEEYEKFIMPKEIPWYAVQCMIEKTIKKQEAANEMVDVKVKEAYDKLLYAQEGYNLKSQLYKRALDKYEDLVTSCKNGTSSEVERKITKIEIDKIKLDVDNLGRDIENGKVQFKSAIGVSQRRKVELADALNKSIKEPKIYKVYLQSALKDRFEIFEADINLREAKRTKEKLEDYFDDDEYEWMNAEKTIDESEVALSEAKKNIEQNIQNAYLDVIHKRKEIELATQNVKKSNQQLDSANKAYETGMGTISLTLDAELGLNKSQMDYNTAVRNYKLALYKLEKASKIGPNY